MCREMVAKSRASQNRVQGKVGSNVASWALAVEIKFGGLAQLLKRTSENQTTSGYNIATTLYVYKIIQ